jgi:hypothetical protein
MGSIFLYCGNSDPLAFSVYGWCLLRTLGLSKHKFIVKQLPFSIFGPVLVSSSVHKIIE